ncbi:MAG: transcriptional regulator [Rickettsiaceae bacterium]|jgi:two-component system OmpR family response regulator|nr:transcriptional regulator [Rickettsiaceae bacterium]
MKILIVEDNVEIADQLGEHLKESGFVVHIENDGEDGCFEGEEGQYDAVLLDVGLPNMDGFSILEQWRKAGKTMPVIILTARNSKSDTIRGLEAGADDYITKPFDLDEVAARIRANIRRNRGHAANTATCGNVTFDMKSGRVLVGGKFVKLTRTEFLMVQYLFMNQGRPISVNELVDHTYEDFDNDSGIVARHIANIRKKIGANVIQTEANRGYYVPLDDKK